MSISGTRERLELCLARRIPLSLRAVLRLHERNRARSVLNDVAYKVERRKIPLLFEITEIAHGVLVRGNERFAPRTGARTELQGG